MRQPCTCGVAYPLEDLRAWPALQLNALLLVQACAIWSKVNLDLHGIPLPQDLWQLPSVHELPCCMLQSSSRCAHHRRLALQMKG